jgi:hypothetical protein
MYFIYFEYFNLKYCQKATIYAYLNTDHSGVIAQSAALWNKNTQHLFTDQRVINSFVALTHHARA